MADKHLWLIRHAKASAHGRPDHARELAYRGYRQCVEMGQFLSTVAEPPTVFLTSDARRTYTTAHVLNAFVGEEVVPVGDMYTYDVDVLASSVATIIEKLDLDAVNNLAVVGHNSAISDLIAALTLDSSTPSLPTLGMAELVFRGSWHDVWDSSPISLHRIETPKAKTK
ncbi:MAG: histidine phosphatase family protein [Gammaproteobacteria bacterium]|nr:histidine phosphatase family protein [Gammaproteobacteria bacterium]